jgi:carboxyl-terminal processing protease
MEDGSAIILSVAKYYSPSGKAIQDVGVTPQTVMTEPEAQVELDEDGNPIGQENEITPKDLAEQAKRLNEHVKKLIDTWK